MPFPLAGADRLPALAPSLALSPPFSRARAGATIIAPSGDWTRRAQASILSRTRTTERMGGDAQKAARAEAFDLLDALSRSGALPMDAAALHVVMGATHCFDESLLDTVVQRNASACRAGSARKRTR